MAPDPLEELDRYFARRADTPFGDVEQVSGRRLQSFSIAGQRAASNLLVKAIRALDNDDAGRARAYVDRAVRLPYDRHEQSHPLAMEAHMALEDMRDVLVAIDHDYHLSRTERASLRSATAAVPDRPELRDLDLASNEISDCVVSVLAACRDYRAALLTP